LLCCPPKKKERKEKDFWYHLHGNPEKVKLTETDYNGGCLGLTGCGKWGDAYQRV